MVSEGLGLGYRATVVCMGSNRQSISTTEIQVGHVDQQHTSVHKATEKRFFLATRFDRELVFGDFRHYCSDVLGFLWLHIRRCWLWVFFPCVVLASLRERHNGTVDEPKAKVLRDHHNGLSMDSGISV